MTKNDNELMIRTGLLSARFPEAFAKATTFGQLAVQFCGNSQACARGFAEVPGSKLTQCLSQCKMANSRCDLNLVYKWLQFTASCKR